MKVLISNIQRFSLHDGPGIRTTVFFMGCPLQCPWCCNPENRTEEIKTYEDDFGVTRTYGKQYSVEELKKEVLKDQLFYKEEGGITYSGGEPLLQLSKILSLLKYLKQTNISQCVETTLSVPNCLLENVLDYIDLFYIDLKILNKEELKEKLNGDFDLIYSNLKILKKKNKKIVFRIPVVKGYSYNEDNFALIKNIVKEFKPIDVEVFSVHNLAKKKYTNLKLEYEDFETIDDKELERIKKYITSK